MDFSKMSLDELKDYAKSIGMTVGNIGKDKLIEKIKEKEKENEVISNIVGKDEDLTPVVAGETDDAEEKVEPVEEVKQTTSELIGSISDAIDDLDETEEDDTEYVTTLSMDEEIPVKSITYGGLTYKSRTNNATFRWNNIGAIQYMTVAELNEMNNYKKDFLSKPMVILMDERAIKKFRLVPVYENVAKINNLKQVFASDIGTISRVIDQALEVNMRDVLISKISQMIKNKALVDINVIKLVSDKLTYDFDEILEK